MEKHVLLYGYIDSYSSSELVKNLIEALDDEGIVMHVNTPGGSPEYTWGIMSNFTAIKGAKKVIVEGQAHSAGAYACCYADDVEAVDTAEFLIHRAAYPQWYESNPDWFDAATRGNLERVNASLKKALEGKIDVAAFEALKGVKLKDIFSMDNRLDVYLTAKEAKQIGLVNRVVQLTPKKKAEITAALEKVASRQTGVRMAAASSDAPTATPPQTTSPLNSKTTNMTLADFKAQHPNLVADIKKEAIAEERDRVEAWMEWNDVDAKVVAEGIKTGAELGKKELSAFARKAANANVLQKVEEEAAAPVTTEERAEKPLTAAEKEVASFKAEVESKLGLGKKSETAK